MDREENSYKWQLWRGVVVIVSATETEDHGFESRQGVRILGLDIVVLFFVS
jgi:hypothetical protein